MSALAMVGNHLWQSTLFAAIVGLATLAFRKNRAAVRHALWLATSIKFLVPFAALVALGGAMGLRAAAPTTTVHREVTIVINDPGHAFPLSPIDLASPASLLPTSASMLATLAPIAAAIWIGGSLLILAIWIVRWRRVSAITRAAARIDSGRDLAALRAIEQRAGCGRPIALVSRAPEKLGAKRPKHGNDAGENERGDRPQSPDWTRLALGDDLPIDHCDDWCIPHLRDTGLLVQLSEGRVHLLPEVESRLKTLLLELQPG